MRLYLREDLIKSESKPGADKKPATSKSGELRGGSYVARVQVGNESDGSPKYRYFKTQEEYDHYLGNKKSEGTKLEDKVEKEHKESTKKQHHPDLLAIDHDRKESKPVAKSLRLFVRG